VAVLLLAVLVLAGACAKKAAVNPLKPTTTTTSTTLVPRPSGYVALGDSYAAGGGAPPYDVSAECAVSSKGYPYTLAADDPALHLVTVRACGGAKTDDLLAPFATHSQPAQIPTKPNDTVGLVTFTIGGNDTSLPVVIAACATLDCADLKGAAAAKAQLAALTDKLVDKVYPALRKAYPKARLVHVGYPYLTSTRLNETCPWLAPNEETIPNKVIDAVDAAISSAAGRSGDVEYVDVRTAFRGHELCSDHPWANDVTAGLSALHPNAAGYVALGKVIATALEH
jgi:lysophospholipase L1-like esterase